MYEQKVQKQIEGMYRVLLTDYKNFSGTLRKNYLLIEIIQHILINIVLVFFTNMTKIQLFIFIALISIFMLFFIILRPLKFIIFFIVTILYYFCLLAILLSLLILQLELEKNLTNNVEKRITIGWIYGFILIITNAGIVLFFLLKIMY